MVTLSLRKLTKRFGAVAAVEQANLDVNAGEFLVIVGESGCGKTTTLRLIAGLEQPDSGTIFINGAPVNDIPVGRRNVQMIFQNYALWPHMRVFDADRYSNLTLPLKVRKWTSEKITEYLRPLAWKIGIDESHFNRKPTELSGGQQQRVALGRAIIAETPLCLMDEPLSNLDAQLRHEMRREIRSLQQKLGITMVYVTHDQTEAMTMADQVVLLRDGRIEQDGTPEALYNRPATAFTARFIGTPPMNVISLPGHARNGQWLGVRPEDIQIGGEGIAAVVESVEYLGADSIVACRAGSETVTVRVPRAPDYAAGAAVKLSWEASAVHYFDAATGLRSN